MEKSKSENAVRSSMLAVGLVLTIQGVPFLHAGDEFLRTKYGNGNSYNANDAINAIKWTNKIQFKEVFEYQKGLIELRNRHPAFRMDSKAQIEDKIDELHKESQVTVYKIGEYADGDDWKNIYVAYNGSDVSRSVSFGNTKPLTIVVNAAKAGIKDLGTIGIGANYELPPYSMFVAFEPGGDDKPVLDRVELSPKTANIIVDETVTLELTWWAQGGDEFFGARPVVVWSSDKPDVATVDANGRVTGLKEGTATITAKAGDLTPVTAGVTVRNTRYLVVVYDSPNALEGDVWKWEKGEVDGVDDGFATAFTAWDEAKGLWAAVIPVSAEAGNVGFIVRKVAKDEWASGNKESEEDMKAVFNSIDRLVAKYVKTGTGKCDPYDDITGVSIPTEHVTVTNYNSIYDGEPHNISVDVIGGGTVSYGVSPRGAFRSANPSYTEAGTYTVYFQIDRGFPWKPYIGSGTVTIIKAKLKGDVAITGDAKYGAELTATVANLGTDPSDKDMGMLTYQWKRGDTNIGTNSDKYTLVQADIGQVIKVTVTAVNCDGSLVSNPTAAVVKKDGPAAPTVTGTYIGEGLTFTYIINRIEGAEYSKDGVAWQDSNTFSGFTTSSPATTFHARIKETPTQYAGGTGSTSPVTFTKLPGPPAPAVTGAYTGNGATFTFTIEQIKDAEYSKDGTTWQDSNIFTGFTISSPATKFYARIKETPTQRASEPGEIGPLAFVKLPGPLAPVPVTGSYDEDGATYTYTVDEIIGAEYSKDGSAWQDSNEFTGFTSSSPSTTFYARIKATDTHNESASGNTGAVTFSKVTGPDAPDSVTGTYDGDGSTFTYTVNKIEDAEYSKDGVTWQDSNVFTGFTTSSTATIFYARMKETDTHNAGKPGKTSPVTFLKLAGLAAPDSVIGSYIGDGATFTYTVDTIIGAEYSKDGATWQDSNVFTDFDTSSAETTFYARMKETDTHNEGSPGNTGAVKFEKLDDQAVPALDFSISAGDFPKTITITPVAGAEYKFNAEGGWGSDNTYISDSGEDVILYIRMAETNTHLASGEAEKTVNTSNESQPPPPAFTLKVDPVGDTSYTVTIPVLPGAEYSFDGTTWDGINVAEGCIPGETVTGYVRLAAKPGYNASGAVSASETLPLFRVMTPVAAPNGGTFTQSQSVSLTCDTEGAAIYYTLDGADPAQDGILYAEPLTLAATTTLKAIAVKAGMTNSAELTAVFTRNPTRRSQPTASNTATVPGDGGEVTVAIPVAINGETGEVVLKPNAEMIEALIADAQEHGRGITFDLSGVEDAKTAVLDVDTARAISEAGDSLTIIFHDSEVNFDTEALALLAHVTDAGTTPIFVKAEIIPMEELTGMQAAQAFGYATVVNVEVFVGDAKLDVPMTISLPYELKAGEDPAAVCAWYMNDDGDLTRLSGVYDTETGMITFMIGHQSCFVVGYEPVALWKNIFSDVTEGAWYYDAVAYANFYSLFNGDGKGRFMHSDTMSRAMFATVLWNIEDRPSPEGAGSFSDVPGEAWFHDAIVWMAEVGIVSGSSNGKFEPKRAITRQEMVLLLSNHAKMKDYDVPKNREFPQFSDYEQIDTWAQDAAKSLAEAGVINGSNGKFNPKDSATRAEVATLFKSYMRFIVAHGTAEQ